MTLEQKDGDDILGSINNYQFICFVVYGGERYD